MILDRERIRYCVYLWHDSKYIDGFSVMSTLRRAPLRTCATAILTTTGGLTSTAQLSKNSTSPGLRERRLRADKCACTGPFPVNESHVITTRGAAQ